MSGQRRGWGPEKEGVLGRGDVGLDAGPGARRRVKRGRGFRGGLENQRERNRGSYHPTSHTRGRLWCPAPGRLRVPLKQHTGCGREGPTGVGGWKGVCGLAS